MYLVYFTVGSTVHTWVVQGATSQAEAINKVLLDGYGNVELHRNADRVMVYRISNDVEKL